MAGLAIAINTHMFRCSVQSWILGRSLSPFEGGYLEYSAAFMVPSLGIPLIKLARIKVAGQAQVTNVRWNPVDFGLCGLAVALLLGCLYSPDIDLAVGIVFKFVTLGTVYYVFARNWMEYQNDPIGQAEIFMKWTWFLALLAGFTAVVLPRSLRFGRGTVEVDNGKR